MYIINTISHGKGFVRNLRTRSVFVSKIKRVIAAKQVRFLIRQQLVRKDRKSALSKKAFSISLPCRMVHEIG